MIATQHCTAFGCTSVVFDPWSIYQINELSHSEACLHRSAFQVLPATFFSHLHSPSPKETSLHSDMKAVQNCIHLPFFPPLGRPLKLLHNFLEHLWGSMWAVLINSLLSPLQSQVTHSACLGFTETPAVTWTVCTGCNMYIHCCILNLVFYFLINLKKA